MLVAPQRAIITNQPGDTRHSIDGLALLVEAVHERSPLSVELFMFIQPHVRQGDTAHR